MRKTPASRPTRAGAKLVLAGDVGGTKTLIGLFRTSARGVTPLRCAAYASGAHESLEDIVGQFLAVNGAPRVAAACFGVAGPILGGATRLTNLPWRLAERDLSASLGGPGVHLLNDVQAAAYGMLRMDKRAFALVQPGCLKRVEAMFDLGSSRLAMASPNFRRRHISKTEKVRSQVLSLQRCQKGYCPWNLARRRASSALSSYRVPSTTANALNVQLRPKG